MHACMYKHACKRQSLSLNPCASHRKQLTQHARTRAELQHSNDVLTPGSLDLHEEKRRHQHRRRPSVPSCRENSCDGGRGWGTAQDENKSNAVRRVGSTCLNLQSEWPYASKHTNTQHIATCRLTGSCKRVSPFPHFHEIRSSSASY